MHVLGLPLVCVGVGSRKFLEGWCHIVLLQLNRLCQVLGMCVEVGVGGRVTGAMRHSGH